MRLFEVITGPEIYKIPDIYMATIVRVELESLDDILNENCLDYYPIIEQNKILFNTASFVKALEEGFSPAVELFFLPNEYVFFGEKEFEKIKSFRNNLVTSQYLDTTARMIDKFYQDSCVEYLEWKTRLQTKLCCLCFINTIEFLLENKTLSNLPEINIFKDPERIDQHIEEKIFYFKDLSLKYDTFVPRKYILEILRHGYRKI